MAVETDLCDILDVRQPLVQYLVWLPKSKMNGAERSAAVGCCAVSCVASTGYNVPSHC
jgi:hypothetical protein